jgi:hypothetical protein
VTTLVGLSGYARSGKDTAAEALVADGWERRAFADSLRRFLYALNPMVLPSGTRLRSFVNAYGWETAKTTCAEVRELLQRCGTEAGREVIGRNVWVDATLGDLTYLEQRQPVVVTDVRFPNEADYIKHHGGIVVRVNRPGVGPNTKPDGTVHGSETALDGYPFDFVIDNDSTPEALHEKIRCVTLAGVCK